MKYISQHFRSLRPGSLSFRVSRDKAGDYQCVSGGVSGRGRALFASLPASLAVAQLGDFAPERDDAVEAFVGNDVVIDCSVPDSNPPAFVQFYKASELHYLQCSPDVWSTVLSNKNGPYKRMTVYLTNFIT